MGLLPLNVRASMPKDLIALVIVKPPLLLISMGLWPPVVSAKMP
jgi:hypothetical protein